MFALEAIGHRQALAQLCPELTILVRLRISMIAQHAVVKTHHLLFAISEDLEKFIVCCGDDPVEGHLDHAERLRCRSPYRLILGQLARLFRIQCRGSRLTSTAG